MTHLYHLIRILTYTTLFALISPSVLAYESGNYPSLAQISIPSGNHTLSQGHHPITYAIEQSIAIPLLDQASMQANWNYILPSEQFSNDYLYRRLNPQSLIQVTAPLIKDFVCAEYRFRHRKPNSLHCTNNQIEHNTSLEAMPFVSGQFTDSNLTSDYDNKYSRISYEASLPSSLQFSLNSLGGSVHELGRFFGRLASSHSLILNIRINIYKLDSDHFRGSALNRSPISLWVIIPPARDLSQQQNQNQAAKFALKHAKLLLIDKHEAW